MALDPVADFPRGQTTRNTGNPLATAHWLAGAEVLDQLGEWQPGALLLGRVGGQYVGVRDDRHILTVAGSRAGKGVSLIIPNLIHWPGSAIAIDPKGELARLTASRRSEGGSKRVRPMGGRAVALDPFKRVCGPAEDHRGAFNPLARLDPQSDEGHDLASLIADSLVVQQEGAAAHWTQSARAFLRGLVLYVAKVEPPATRHLIRVREILTSSKDEFEAHLGAMAAIEGPIARAAHSLILKPANERGSVISTCDVQTDFLEGAPMRRVLAGHDFDLEDMKRERVTVYLCLPAGRLATHGRWLRLMVNLAMEAMEQTGPLQKGQHPVLFCLDEFAALGHMETIERAAGQIAGFGVKLWPIIQDLTQLQRDYRASWETFMGNAGALTFFGNTDLTTLEHVSRRLGECEILRTLENTSASAPGALSQFGKGAGHSRTTQQTQSLQRNSLMTADEVGFHFARERGNLLAFLPAMRPIALKRCFYYSKKDAGMFGGLYDSINND